jgi:hypothetical protein
MKVRVFKVFGREVLRIESHEEASLADVISGLVAQRMQIKQNTAQCECCGEDFDPDEDDDDETDDDEVDARFNDMTERLVWDAQYRDYPDEPDISDE